MRKIVFLILIFLTLKTFPQATITEGAFKFATLLKIVENSYVDSVQEEKLVEDAIVGMLKELDPHSTYITKEDLQKMNEPLQGNFEGIGIQFNILNDTILVVTPISGGPSEKVGIQAGDKIITVDGENVAGIGITNKGVADRLRGPKGTQVTVEVLRSGEKEPLEFTITRDKIPIFSVDAAYMAAPKIGYIKVNRFSATTMHEFKKAVEDLKAQGMEHLILDLRNNSGGYLRTAIELSDEFLPSGKMIVYTEGRSFPKKEIFSTAIGEVEQGKIVVLINEGSASASEIVSGAIQDNDRGVIIGRRSFGKGLVQKPYNLPDGSQVRLTIQRYYTPSGRCIQKPYEDYKSDFKKRYEHGELFHKDSIDFPDSLKFQTTKGRTVYGGGGIMPDVFVPLDTSYNSKYYSKLLRKGIFNRFTLTYLDKHRDELEKSYPDIKTFKQKFNPEDYLNEFLGYAEKQKIEFDKKDFERSKPLILTMIKADFARNLFGTGAYYQIYNEINPTYQKALEVINDDTFDKLQIDY